MASGLEDLDLARLAQYRPFEGGGEAMGSAHEDLVGAACRGHDKGFQTYEVCRAHIQETWRIELELSEVEGAADRLEKAGEIQKGAGGRAITLTTGARQRMDEDRKVWDEAATRAVEEWETAVRTEFPLLSDEGMSILREQLRPWLNHVIARHGAEASVLLYPGNPHTEPLIDRLGDTSLGFLPECGSEVGPIRVSAFRMFVREPTAAQRELLGRLLNTGFYVTVLSLDPRAEHLVQSEAKKVTLYLDTNFLYAVLGVASGVEARSAGRLLELSRDLGYSFRVTPWTIDELRTSIASSRADVMKVHRSRKTAQVMAKVTGEKGFAVAFWRELRDTGVNPVDFFAKYDHFMRFLKEHGIEEHPEQCPEVEADQDGVQVYASQLEGMYGVGAKDRRVIEHDAKSRLLIERLRGTKQPPTYSDVRYWFLTESTRLPTAARMPMTDGERPQYPFCILSSTWAQLVRAMSPRTEDLDDVMVGLLASPFVGYNAGLRGTSRKAVERVVARIDSLQDVPPSVAIALVNDGAMATKIGEETDEQEVDKLVDESLTEKARQLEDSVAETAQRAAAAEQAKQRADQETTAALERENAARAEREEAERDKVEAARKRDEQETLAKGLRTRVATLEDERSTEKAGRERAERRATLLRNVLAIAVAVVAAVVAGTFLVSVMMTGQSE